MSNTMSPEELAATVERLANLDIEAMKQQPNFETSRRKALAASRSLFQSLENPYEMGRRLGWADSTVTVVLLIAIDMGFLKELRDGQASGTTTESIAKATNQPHELVKRVLRHLAANKIIKQTAPNTYAPTANSNAMLEPMPQSGPYIWRDIFVPALMNLPAYFSQGTYLERAEPGKTNFEQVMGTPFFPWMKERPVPQRRFFTHLEAYKVDRAEWVETYPAKERLLEGADDSGPLVVDVGGGVGQATQAFYKRYPQSPGRLYVQDLEHVLKEASIDPNIMLYPHDFLTPQPIQGARAYLLQFILHDWIDEKCLEILGQLRGAMKKDYSKLLVSEYVIAEQNPDPIMTALDWAVECVLGAVERTEEDWHKLFAKAGMKIENIYSLSPSNESVIEVVLA